MDTCLFCKIVTKKIPAHVVWEDEHLLAFLDIHPISTGHTLLVPKDHRNDLFSMTTEQLTEIAAVLPRLAKQIRTAVSADGINIGMNNGASTGQIISHAHIHIIPRFAGDGLKHWPGRDELDETLQETAQAIRSTARN